MRVRVGFVSNSSTTSYVLIGYEMGEDFDRIGYAQRRDPQKYQELYAEGKEKCLEHNPNADEEEIMGCGRCSS